MAKVASKKQAKDDLIMTLESDSENEPIQYSSESESEPEIEQKPAKKTKKANKKGAKVDSTNENDNKEDDEDINPEFKFSLDGFETTKFEGWDFKVKEEAPKSSKDVDLDGILRRKGGLVNLAAVEGTLEKPEEEEEEEEESEEEEEEIVDEASDDELAMDGFGMGAEETDHTAEDKEQEEEQEEEEEDDSDVEADMDAEHPGSDLESEAEENEEDSAEKMAEFYETPEATTTQTHMSFQSLQLSRPILKGLSQLGYTTPSPIQSASIPIALMGKDIVAGAVTGSGKTAAYMIPIIERLLYKPSKVSATRVIVLTPTRELSIQVCDVGKKIGRFVNNLNFGLAVGGLNLRQQEQQLKTRPDIVIATPGRLIDHIRNSPSFNIDSLEILVIDEADRMLEEGFQVELTEILSLIPKHKRQTLLFSATMNTKIQDLIQLSLQKPVRIMIDPPKSTSNKLIQEFVRIRKRDHLKFALLFQLLKDINPDQASRIVVFVSRKETAHKLRIILGLLGMKVSELHGSLSQEQRLKNVSDFKNLVVPVLICTDLASRGLDIPKIEIVINFDMPKSHEIYLHRVGRTARAGRDGRSISFVGESTQDRAIVKDTIKVLSEDTSSVKSKAVSRNVDWKQIEGLNKIIEEKKETIDEVLEEEKQAKEILLAEMEINKATNIMNHEKEIQSRPKRTWFKAGTEDKKQTEVMKHLTKHGKQVNSKKRKAIEVKKDDGGRSYKKTKNDRMDDQKRNPKAKIGKGKGKGKRR